VPGQLAAAFAVLDELEEELPDEPEPLLEECELLVELLSDLVAEPPPELPAEPLSEPVAPFEEPFLEPALPGLPDESARESVR
jgi:hypothetical protein